MLILTACGATVRQERALLEAAARQAAAEVTIVLEEQPAECGQDWKLLPRRDVVGWDGWSVVRRYEAMITRQINPQKRNCFVFNEDQRLGLLEGRG